MSALEKIIGYETIKRELNQICDMVHNKGFYEKLGAKMPNGLLLYGEPGLGKTLMARCFTEQCGLECYTIRRNKGQNEFVSEITKVFETAKKNSPCIVFLDDIDKFANEDDRHRDAEEYVAVQAGIDLVRGSSVFVIATANDIDKLPDSLIRAGRFDRQLEIKCPTDADSGKIIEHYLKEKNISGDVNIEDVTKMLSYSSCAELEMIINEAAISAGYSRRDYIEMPDIVSAVLRSQYNSPDNDKMKSDEEMRKVALHEAGHLVISEVLCEGSVGLASIRKSGRNSHDGFVYRCKSFTKRPYCILQHLGGKAAVELYYAESVASGCMSDIEHAAKYIKRGILENATSGLGMVEVPYGESDNYKFTTEAVVHAELERYILKARDILIKNREFLEKTAKMLFEKETLLYSDIRKIRESVTIVNVAV